MSADLPAFRYAPRIPALGRVTDLESVTGRCRLLSIELAPLCLVAILCMDAKAGALKDHEHRRIEARRNRRFHR